MEAKIQDGGVMSWHTTVPPKCNCLQDCVVL